MNFTHYDLGERSQGEIVHVTLEGNEANVLLLDSSNFQNYRNRRRFSYYGGHYKRSPARISVPYAGHWHIAIDLGGYVGRVKSSVQVY